MMNINNKIQCIDIDFKNKNHIKIFTKFYDEIYAKEFPNEDERETKENIVKQNERMKNLSQCEHHCIIAILENEIAGGIIGDYFSECNSCAIEFIVTDSMKRNSHIGTTLISNFINACNLDSKKYLNKSYIDYCFFETENPYKVDKSIKDYCINRLHFWDKLLARRINIDYVQMPLEENKNAVECLYLALMVINENLDKSLIDKVTVLKFVECYFRYAFNTGEKENIKELEDLKNSILDKEKIELVKLV